MNKLVYLEELDSVRNTPAEIKLGQQALYEEIVINGNKVALTFNQALDSRAFLSAIENEQQHTYIVELFQKGYLRFSSFAYMQKDGTRFVMGSASQYIQNAIQKALDAEHQETYIFSGLPITSKEEDLLRLLNEAIQYSNPAILERYSKYKQDKERIDYLQRYVKTVLQMSVEKLANNPVKETPGKPLEKFIEELMQFPAEQHWAGKPKLFASYKEAVCCLKTIQPDIKAPNNRSNWHDKLQAHKPAGHLMAEAIVNVAYNYTVEDSIAGISKHYDDNDMNDFYQDFAHRFEKYWTECEKGIHQLCPPKKTAHELYKDWKGMPHWATATRLVANRGVIKHLEKKESLEATSTDTYETNFQSEKNRWNTRTVLLLCMQFVIAIIIAFVIHGFNETSKAVEDFVGNALSTIGIGGDNLTIFITNFLLYTVGFGTIWSLLQMLLNLPDIAENLKKLALSIYDGFIIATAPRQKAYKRNKKGNKHE